MPLTHNQLLADAEAFRSHLTFSFIAITGSNGKTATKNMLSQILHRVGHVYDFDQNSDRAESFATELLTLKGTYDYAIVKIGAATPNEIKWAAPLIRPRIAIITNVGEAHLAQHGTIDKIASAKAELLTALEKGGTAILNRDNELTRAMGMELAGKVVYFGLSPVSDYYAADIQHLGPEGTFFTVHQSDKLAKPLKMAIFSLGDVYNALAAYAAASELGIDSDIICAALQNHFSLPDGRGRMHAFAGLRILDDTYDATPQSFYKSTKSLINFRAYAKRLIFVMGDMTEHEEQAPVMHTMMGHYLAGMPIDIVVLAGKYTSATAEAIANASGSNMRVVECETPREADGWLVKNMQTGDIVLVEGSAVYDMGEIVRNLVQFGLEKWGRDWQSPEKAVTIT